MVTDVADGPFHFRSLRCTTDHKKSYGKVKSIARRTFIVQTYTEGSLASACLISHGVFTMRTNESHRTFDYLILFTWWLKPQGRAAWESGSSGGRASTRSHTDISPPPSQPALGSPTSREEESVNATILGWAADICSVIEITLAIIGRPRCSTTALE